MKELIWPLALPFQRLFNWGPITEPAIFNSAVCIRFCIQAETQLNVPSPEDIVPRLKEQKVVLEGTDTAIQELLVMIVIWNRRQVASRRKLLEGNLPDISGL